MSNQIQPGTEKRDGSVRILGAEYYRRPATELAPDVVGKILCRRMGDEVIRLRITETECYFGEEDTACHAHRGRTPRTGILYAAGGYAYVYLCYGMHNLLNLVTGKEGHPEAVLLRGVEGFMGPGRLTRALGIDRSLNQKLLIPENGLWLEDDGYRPASLLAAPRIGIGYAAPEDRERLWRFTDACAKK